MELTYILENSYKNYHFQEEVRDKQVVFDYQLRSGRATSRNAIKLLERMEYPNQVIKKADDAATYFLQTGVWNNL